MSDISIPKRLAMANAVKRIQDGQARTFAMLKADRFLADSDWTIAVKAAYIHDPYKTEFGEDVSICSVLYLSALWVSVKIYSQCFAERVLWLQVSFTSLLMCNNNNIGVYIYLGPMYTSCAILISLGSSCGPCSQALFLNGSLCSISYILCSLLLPIVTLLFPYLWYFYGYW